MKAKKLLALGLSVCLIFCAVFSFSVNASTPLSMQQQAFEKAKYLQSIIKRDVSHCSWTEKTICRNIVPLYDPNLQINGYIFEYSTEGKEAGYIQISTIPGYPILDSYSLNGTHWATGFQNTNKLIRLGAFSYYTIANDSQIESVKDKEERYSLTDAKSIYSEYLSTLQNPKSETREANANSIYTQTVFAQGYHGGLTLATYSNTGDRGNGCCRIAAVNSCLYWAKCRGKTGLYTSNSQTYSAISSFIPLPSNGQNMDSNTYNGLNNYMKSKGYVPTVRGTIFPNNGEWKWGTLTNLIDRGITPILNIREVQYVDGTAVPYGHAVLMLGYQHIDVVNTLIVANGRSTTYTYLSTEVYPPFAGGYSHYNGW